jgi:hypothetical protein
MTSIEASREYRGCDVLDVDDYIGSDESSEEELSDDDDYFVFVEYEEDEEDTDDSGEPAHEQLVIESTRCYYAAGAERSLSVPLVGSRYLDQAPATYRIYFSLLNKVAEQQVESDADDVREEFERLKEAWEEKSEYMSVLTDMVLLQEYQRIIGLGRPAVPLLIEELRNGGDHWFWALVAITGRDHAEGAKNYDEAVARWIDWYEACSNE